MAAEAFL